MVACKTITTYKSNKSQAIMELVQKVETRKLEGEILKGKIISKEMKELSLKYQSLQRLIKTAGDKISSLSKVKAIIYSEANQLCKDLGIVLGMDGKFRALTFECRIPDKVVFDLQRATDLFAIGRRAQAKEIWEKIITDYNLDKE